MSSPTSSQQPAEAPVPADEELKAPASRAGFSQWDVVMFGLCMGVALIVFALFKLTVGVQQSWGIGVVGAVVLGALISVVAHFVQ